MGLAKVEKILVMGDNMGCLACDGQLDEFGIVRIAIELETDRNGLLIIAIEFKSLQEKHDAFCCDLRISGQDLGIVQDTSVLCQHRLTEYQDKFSFKTALNNTIRRRSFD